MAILAVELPCSRTRYPIILLTCLQFNCIACYIYCYKSYHHTYRKEVVLVAFSEFFRLYRHVSSKNGQCFLVLYITYSLQDCFEDLNSLEENAFIQIFIVIMEQYRCVIHW